MQHYEFPEIKNLDDVLPHIEGRSEFNVNQRDEHLVVDYAFTTPSSFPPIPVDAGPERTTAIMRRECRGLLFNKDGGLLRRSLHKFHNIGEREEMLPENIDFSKPHHILDKLDGSMLSSYMAPDDQVKWISQQDSTHFVGKVFWGTQFGNTDVADGAAQFVNESNFDYEGFARSCMSEGWTPIFEWCSLKNRVVIRHEQPKLVLIAIRHQTTGCYKTYNEMVDSARNCNIPVVKSFGRVDDDPTAFIERTRGEEGIEGYIVRFDDGHSTKLKCDWYVRFHNAVENLLHEKNVWEMVLRDDIDDVLPVLMEQDKDHLIKFYGEFQKAITDAAGLIESECNDMQHAAGGDQKRFAELVKANDHLVGPMKGMAFRINSKGTTGIDLIREYAGKSTGSRSKIEEARKIIMVQSWN
jgi:RNA ligase